MSRLNSLTLFAWPFIQGHSDQNEYLKSQMNVKVFAVLGN